MNKQNYQDPTTFDNEVKRGRKKSRYVLNLFIYDKDGNEIKDEDEDFLDDEDLFDDDESNDGESKNEVESET